MKISKEQLKNILFSLDPKEYSNSELQINCPECGGNECYISIKEDNHPFGCFRASKCIPLVGNIYTLRKYGIKFGDSDKLTNINDDFQKISLNVFQEEKKTLNLPLIKLPLGYKRVLNDSYLSKRGFTERDYNYFEVGRTSFGSLKDYVIFPIYQGNEIKAYVSRLARPQRHDKEKRYDNSTSEFASILGGLDSLTERTETVILCEGLFDIINITRLLNLYDCDEIKAVCTFGAKVSDNQINLLQQKGIKRIIMLFDGDVIKKIKPISFELNLKFDTQIALLDEGKDIDAGNCTIEQLESALNNLSSPLDFYTNKIEIKSL